jgi:O-antigen ligase
VAVAIAIAAGLPGYLSDRWHDFKQPGGAGTSAQRFESASGNGRYQYWSSALDAQATAPLTGIGPGTFQYWWAENGTISGFIRDAHSLYFQTLAETGIVGLVLLGGLIGFLLVSGARTARTASLDRSLLAGAVAACAAFAVAAAVDWVWQLPVLPVAFLLLGAAILAGRERGDADGSPGSATAPAGLRPVGRAAIAGVSLAALVVIALPLVAASALQTSQADARSNQLSSALRDAQNAHDLQPYAATPSLQEALLYELQGDFPNALGAARAATAAESTNWRTWLVLSRIEAESGHGGASLDAYKRARTLNPRSPLFAQ